MEPLTYVDAHWLYMRTIDGCHLLASTLTGLAAPRGRDDPGPMAYGLISQCVDMRTPLVAARPLSYVLLQF